ncbi:MAG: hypothetical protein EOO33_19225, partial [Comamonadaceae bacterium]
MHYYSVKSSDTAAGSNYANDGAAGTNALAAGASASATSDNSVAVGYRAGANEGVPSVGFKFGGHTSVGALSGQSVTGNTNQAFGYNTGNSVVGNSNVATGTG